ncbi:MAG: hypothetical protein ACREV8_02975 [Gammaproteobacteria bacterium]
MFDTGYGPLVSSLLTKLYEIPFARRVADRFCIKEKRQLVAGGAIGELNEELVWRHLTV